LPISTCMRSDDKEAIWQAACGSKRLLNSNRIRMEMYRCQSRAHSALGLQCELTKSKAGRHSNDPPASRPACGSSAYWKCSTRLTGAVHAAHAQHAGRCHARQSMYWAESVSGETQQGMLRCRLAMLVALSGQQKVSRTVGLISRCGKWWCKGACAMRFKVAIQVSARAG
jgi:hypothetical protein